MLLDVGGGGGGTAAAAVTDKRDQRNSVRRCRKQEGLGCLNYV